MLKNDALVKQTYELIRVDLSLEEEWSLENLGNNFDRLEEFLVLQISYLLDHDFNRLLNALYRIDISESEVKRILKDSNSLAGDLARAVLEREKQKVLTRLKYRN